MVPRLALAIALCIGISLMATSSQAAGTDELATACRSQASEAFGVPAAQIDLWFEGRLPDGGYDFEGSTETTPPMMFECEVERQDAAEAPVAANADTTRATN
jgi:hypothetical protein